MSDIYIPLLADYCIIDEYGKLIHRKYIKCEHNWYSIILSIYRDKFYFETCCKICEK